MRRAIFTILLLSCSAWSQQGPATAAAPSAGSPADLVKQGEKLNSEGKQDAALALYSKALEKSPNLYEAHLDAGIALDLKGDYQDARQHLAKAIEVASADAKPQALRAMAMSYAFEGNGKEAEKFEQQVFVARLAGNDFDGAAGIANELARIHLECGDPDNAYKWYKTGYEAALQKKDLSEADKNVWLFRWENAQARIAARRNQREEAQKHVVAAKAALDKANNPGQARFYPYLTGYAAFYAGDYKTAISDLQKADQSDPFILFLMAQSFENAGDQPRAMQYYRKVLTSNQHNPGNAFARPAAKKKLGEAGK
jgi:tetratricopeptide (TPR) repeat protein